MTSTPTHLDALRITHDAMQHIVIDTTDTVTQLHHAIGCRTFDVVNLDHDIDLFVDDEGLINGSGLNLVLTVIVHALGKPVPIFGDAVALGVDYDTGDSRSLTRQQKAHIIDVLATTPPAALIDQVCNTLAPIPHAVAILRSMF